MKIETIEIAGFKPAMIAMRLPMKSGDRSDSGICSEVMKEHCGNTIPELCFETPPHCFACVYENEYVIGPKDHELSMKLCKAGPEHRKHIRDIIVWAKITAPLMWMIELDTYMTVPAKHVCSSTMHTLNKDGFSEDTIEFDLGQEFSEELEDYFAFGNKLLDQYNKTKDFKYLRAAKQILGGGFQYTLVQPFNYENLRTIYKQRKDHRLKEWHEFCDWIKTLPYSEFILGED